MSKLQEFSQKIGTFFCISVLAILLNFCGQVMLRNFYNFYNEMAKKTSHSNIYNFDIAIKIVNSDNYKKMVICGVIVILATMLYLMYCVYFFKKHRDNIWLVIGIVILAICDMVLAYGAVKYWIIGVVIVGLVAITYSSLTT